MSKILHNKRACLTIMIEIKNIRPHNGQIDFEVPNIWMGQKMVFQEIYIWKIFFPIAESEELLKRKRLRKSR